MKKIDSLSATCYIVGYSESLKAIGFIPSCGTKVVKSINGKFFEVDNNSWTTIIKDIVFEKESWTIFFFDCFEEDRRYVLDKNTPESQLANDPIGLVTPIEPAIGISLKRSQWIRCLQYKMIMFIL